MQIKPAGIDDLAALIHLLNAALEHVPAATKNILESLADPRIKAIEAILNPPVDKNQEHA